MKKRRILIGRVVITCWKSVVASVQIRGSLTIMRLLIAAFITLLSLALSGFASVNFNGTWVLDLKASDSPEAMMKRMGVSVFEHGHPETKTEKRTGPYTIRTSWAHHGKELISTSTFRTKDGRSAELIVARKLIDGGKTLVLSQTLKVEGEPPEPVLHRIWRRKAS